ncbi:hypothetical protein [Saccharothrix texasensis]|uniref:hypothetical protein n=1 Tax=Saccharothrix texasensis TaxID=103734 RepID=UPI0011CE161A|nr:hypothetical protein [Saccharothrix texasensis]
MAGALVTAAGVVVTGVEVATAALPGAEVAAPLRVVVVVAVRLVVEAAASAGGEGAGRHHERAPARDHQRRDARTCPRTTPSPPKLPLPCPL